MIMSNKTYLQSVLDAQAVRNDSQELRDLRAARADIEALINSAFADCDPRIRYGGSKAKGTMNLIDYDLDVISYFPRKDTRAGKTIREIYENVQAALERKYLVYPKTTALHVKDRDRDLHIDVVPGRFIDATETYAFVHQNGRPADKGWLQTNLDRHISHVIESGCIPDIRLSKIWRRCVGLTVRTFPLELLVIKILASVDSDALDERFTQVLESFRDEIHSLSIADPANEGNSLNEALSPSVRTALAAAASTTLSMVLNGGWSAVFGKVMSQTQPARDQAFRTAIITNQTRTQPWRAA